ncbi:MAG: hypothetical protein M3332_06570 [Actinomycetota bacterium]|nr:hypothetical protein [Actinomycetota bacterium]
MPNKELDNTSTWKIPGLIQEILIPTDVRNSPPSALIFPKYPHDSLDLVTSAASEPVPERA